MATVRIFSYSELISARVSTGGGQPAQNSVFMLREPYLAGEILTPSTSVAQSSSANTAPADTRMLKVQVDGGKRCHYEVTSTGQTLRPATSSSPILSGDELIYFAQGYILSLLEVTE